MAPATLTIALERPADVLAQVPHLAHGALLVPAPEPAPRPLEPLLVQVAGPAGVLLPALPGRVVRVLPGLGVALAFDDPGAARAAFAPLVAAARQAAAAPAASPPETAGPAPPSPAASSPVDGAPAAPGGDDEPGGTLFERIRAMSKAERRLLALHGDRAARLALIKSPDKDLHQFVIQNPALTLDEVLYIAGYRQTHPEVLKRIAENRDWSQNPRVTASLVCNPKTPASLAVRLLDRLPIQEIARISRSSTTPPAVQAAARRKVIGA